MNTITPDPADILIERGCPTCGAMDFGEAITSAQPAELQDWEILRQSWRGFFTAPMFFSYGRCHRCGQLYAPTYLSNQAIARLYGSMPDNVHSGDQASSFDVQMSYAVQLSAACGNARRLLEVGSDTGAFARALSELMPIEAAYFAEPNRSVWPELSRSLSTSQITIRSSLAELDELVPDDSIDLVVGVHVLDHMLEPQTALSFLHRKLRSGGKLAFVVHDERSVLARLLKRRWPAFCLQHPQLYNPISLESFLKRSGFGEVEVHSTSNKFPLGYLVSHGLYAAVGLRLDLSFASWPVTLKLGNIMAIARKEQPQ